MKEMFLGLSSAKKKDSIFALKRIKKNLIQNNKKSNKI